MLNFRNLRPQHLLSLAIIAGCLAGGALRAQTSYPMLMATSPLAVQVGTTAECEVTSRYSMRGAYQVLLSGQGVTAEVILPEEKERKPGEKAPDITKLKVRFTVAADALPGPRDFRIATPPGASTIGQMLVVADPIVREERKNDTLAAAQSVTLPATLCGTFEKNEDVDFYKFHAKAGERLAFHVYSARLEDRIHDLQSHADPLLAIKNEAGVVLAANDNYFYADPCLDYLFTTEGDYYIEIRDVRYQGNAFWEYAISVSARPLVTNLHPMAAAPGETQSVAAIGLALASDAQGELAVPADMAPGVTSLPIRLQDQTTNPAPVFVTRLPRQTEAAGDNNTLEKGETIPAPIALSGRIESENDVDYFRFTAKKGESFTFEVHARRYQSSLDPVLRILNAKGARQNENDDLKEGRFTCADAKIEDWSAPADGDYFLELRDLHLRGGASFVYVLTVERSTPAFLLEADMDKILLGPGGANMLYVKAYRRGGFAGEIALEVEGLPPGVTAACGRILTGTDDGCIVFEATADAPVAVSNVTVRGRASHPQKDGEPLALSAIAMPLQEIYMPGGGRGHYPSDLFTVSVGKELDISAVHLSTNTVVLAPGESQRIDITIDRAPGFDKNVSLDLVYRHLERIYGSTLPKGVTIDGKKSKTLVTGKESQGHITLTAAADAPPVEGQIVPVMAHVSINFVMKFTYAGPPLSVSIVPKGEPKK